MPSSSTIRRREPVPHTNRCGGEQSHEQHTGQRQRQREELRHHLRRQRPEQPQARPTAHRCRARENAIHEHEPWQQARERHAERNDGMPGRQLFRAASQRQPQQPARAKPGRPPGSPLRERRQRAEQQQCRKRLDERQRGVLAEHREQRQQHGAKQPHAVAQVTLAKTIRHQHQHAGSKRHHQLKNRVRTREPPHCAEQQQIQRPPPGVQRPALLAREPGRRQRGRVGHEAIDPVVTVGLVQQEPWLFGDIHAPMQIARAVPVLRAGP
jgi:hypothetical protein